MIDVVESDLAEQGRSNFDFQLMQRVWLFVVVGIQLVIFTLGNQFFLTALGTVTIWCDKGYGLKLFCLCYALLR